MGKRRPGPSSWTPLRLPDRSGPSLARSCGQSVSGAWSCEPEWSVRHCRDVATFVVRLAIPV
jgi:hypothetical protein